MEIKFRAFHKTREKMYDVFSFCENYVKIKGHNETIEKLPRNEFEDLMQLWNPSIGLEFFPGDLFLAECSPSGSNKKKERICKVSFSGKGMSISVWYKGEWWAYGSMNFTTAKIIGNISQNSNLLSQSFSKAE